jgi:aspartate/methionine/tyrosine aminotransferase
MSASAIAYPEPAALRAAALGGDSAEYGGSVLELDRAVAAAPGPADLIDLTHGDTRAFVPPATAAADLVAAVRDNDEAYTAYRGSEPLRQLLAPRLAGLLGRSVDPVTELIVTPGTQGGLFAALSSLVGPGDVVALPDPDYFMSERIVAYLGARAVRLALEVGSDGSLRISERALARAADARLLLFSHPNNPTGGVYPPEMVAALADWVADGDRLCVVDQLYCRQLFEGTQFTHLGGLPGMAARTATLVGPSKTESMSGYRVGVAVAPGPVIDTMERVLAMASLRTAAYAQQVLRHWLDGDGDWIARRAAEHQVLRDQLVALLRGIPGVTVASPLGSSYVFPDVAGTAWAAANDVAGGSGDGSRRGDAVAIALKAGGVLINPGYQFGSGAATRFRINFSQDTERLWEACTRIERVLNTG